MIMRDDPALNISGEFRIDRVNLMRGWYAINREVDSRWVNYPWYRLMDGEVVWIAV